MVLDAREREALKSRLRRIREKNGVRTISGVHPSRAYEAAYYRELLRPVNGLAELVDEQLLPVLERYESRYVKTDNSVGFVFDEGANRAIRSVLIGFEAYANSFAAWAERTADKFVDENNQFHRRRFVGEVNKQFGVNISSIMSEDRVQDVLRNATRWNVDLIVDLPKEYYAKINKIVFDGITSGNDFASIRSQLTALKGISKRRAKLIAIDQTGKLIGKLNQVRQENEGISRYQWDANIDARTRDRHVDNDGEVYEWSDTSPGKAFGRPGEEVRCRCVGNPVIEERTLARWLTPRGAGRRLWGR